MSSKLMKSGLFQEAVVDAKAVQTVTLANAKLMLEEAFTPRLQSMLGEKLREELDDETIDGSAPGDDGMEITSEEVDEILKELDSEIHEDEETAPAPSAPVDVAPPADVAPSVDATAPAAPTAPGEVKTVEAPVMVVAPGTAPAAPTDSAPVDVAAAPSAPVPAPDASPEGEVDLDEVNIDELLAELTSLEEESAKEVSEEKVDLSELLNSLNEEESKEESKEGDKEEVSEVQQLQERLDDALKANNFLRDQLKEVNLLNAKLLYTNKIFKAHTLNNSQKMKIIESFDLTKSVREVKLTYNNISEALNLNKVKPAQKANTIVEGLASKSIGTTKPAQTVISEQKIVAEPVNELALRFQKLAGISKV